MPVLGTDRLVMRKFAQEDLGEVVQWEAGHGAENAESEARKFLDYCFREYRERGIGPWAMQLKETGRIIGNCGFPHIMISEQCGEVNYYVAAKYRGKGLAAEALAALLQWGFREIGLVRIQARCDVDNLSSERVMQKVGMKFEELMEPDLSTKNPGQAQKLCAILQEDFESRRVNPPVTPRS